MVKPVTIRQYKQNNEGGFSFDEIAQIDDTMTRFILAEDFDGTASAALSPRPRKPACTG